jgi:hypothetical protein
VTPDVLVLHRVPGLNCTAQQRIIWREAQRVHQCDQLVEEAQPPRNAVLQLAGLAGRQVSRGHEHERTARGVVAGG